jgi:hypothetical protein
LWNSSRTRSSGILGVFILLKDTSEPRRAQRIDEFRALRFLKFPFSTTLVPDRLRAHLPF